MRSSLFSLFLFLTAALSLHTSPVENGDAPQLIQKGFFIPSSWWVDLRAGYEGDFAGDEKLEQTQGGSSRVDTFQQYTNSATVTLNLLDRLDIFGLVGSSRASADWLVQNGSTTTYIELETFYRFLWGMGGRAILFEWGKLSLDAAGRYSLCHYKPSYFSSNGVPQTTENTHIDWNEWQIALVLAYRIDLFTPYLGAQYARTEVNLGNFPVSIAPNDSTSNQFVSRIPVGMVIGCGISNGNYFMLNLEGRLINEEALTISGDLRF
ncbi:MAG: hypothetical protein KGI80_06175 [Verrucomicrobiota bacterium]|nr:hypothetical protein [Verrucomicrobiota bacterium]